MTKTVKTISIGKGIQYAKVNDRLLAFWEDNPRGEIETKPDKIGDSLMFYCKVITDRSDENSRRATGHALSTGKKGEKEFEKLETISLGRALALLGYGADGSIASSEEMDSFMEFKDDSINNGILKMQNCTDLESLKEVWSDMPYKTDSRLITVKNTMKSKLS